MRSTLLLALLLTVVSCGLSARLLAILPFPGRSHHQYRFTILKALAERGHQLVEYSPFPPSRPLANYTHVKTTSSLEEEWGKFTFEAFQQKCKIEHPTVFSPGLKGVWDFTFPICQETFKLEVIQKLLSSKDHFDVVFTESSFGQESFLVFGHKFKAPVINLQSFYTWSVVNRDAGNALSIATIPQFKSLVATHHMTFVERMSNFLSVLLSLYYYYNHHLPRHEELIHQSYSEPVPSLQSMLSDISLHLIITHAAVEYPQPYTPNIVPLGGITITPDRTPLPQEIKKFMDEAHNGVIYFSLGTVVPTGVITLEILQVLINVFKKMRQRVLWRMDLDHIAGLPHNVLLTKWVPQPGVLAHPNCVLFLTHGGLNSQHEAIHAGVPTVGIPFFGDQFFNIRLNEHHGIGVKLDFNTLSEDTLSSALNTIISNPKYKENTMRLSRMYKDQPVPMKDLAVFWVEYVLRHKGASHLRPKAAIMPWYQLALLDVIGAVLAGVIIIIAILYLLVKKLLGLIAPKSKQETSSKMKKN